MPGSGHRWDPLPGWSGKASQGGENPRDTGALPPARPARHRCAVTTPGGGLSGRPTASPQEPELPGDRAHPQAQATEGTAQAAPNTAHIPSSEGWERRQQQRRGSGAAPKGQVGPRGCRQQECRLSCPGPTLQGCLYKPQAGKGLQRPSTHS